MPELSAEYYKGINPERTKKTLSTFSKADAEVVSHFISTCQAQSGIKLARVTGILDGFVAWKKIVKTPLRSMKIKDVNAGVTAIREKYSDNTAIQHISTIKAFCTWMIEQEISKLPLVDIRKIKLPKPNKMSFGPGDILAEEEIALLISCATTPRDKAIIATIYDGKFRAVDIALATWGDIDMDLPQTASLQTAAKTGVPRKVSLATCKEYLIAWRNAYPGTASGAAPLFVTEHGDPRPMKYSTLLKILGRIKEKAIKRGLDPKKAAGLHQFRRAAITHDANKGRPLPHISMEAWGKPYSPMIDRYVKPSEDDITRSKLEVLGIEKRKYTKRKTAMMPTQCPGCGFVNSPGIEYCSKCGHGLTEAAMQSVEERENRMMEKILERVRAEK